MAPSPKKYEETATPPAKSTSTATSRAAKAAPKQITCFIMNTPPQPGLIPVSTGQVKDGCFVLGWQTQQTTMLVTESAQWYAYASKILKANFAFTAVFAFALLVVLVVNRGPR